MYTTIKTDLIARREPFLSLFPIRPADLDNIQASMGAEGFDGSKPLDVWRICQDWCVPSESFDPGDNPDWMEFVLVDGHTRLTAAMALGFDEVPVFLHDFDSDQDALEYAIRNQRNRRSLTDAEILKCVAVLDERKSHGGDRGNQHTGAKAPSGALAEKTAVVTAELLGVSPRTVERARTVLDHATEPVLDAVERGEKSVNAAYNETQERRKEEKEKAEEMGVMEELKMTPPQPASKLQLPVLPALAERGLYIPSPSEVDELRAASTTSFNNQKGNDAIEWARWSWNPVTGCLHGCEYCYARDIAARFYEQGFAPTFIPERLGAPRNTKPPKMLDSASEVDRIGWRNVFVCSMADLWGKWVPSEIIRYVMRETTEQAQWNYLFLTKFPQRYEEFAGEFPANTWVGTTVDSQHAVHRAEKAFRKLRDAGHQGVRWLSVEPVPQDGSLLEFSEMSLFDWIVIGGASRSTQTPEWTMTPEQFVSLYTQARAAGCRVYLKDNAGVFGSMRVREYPEATR